MRSLSTLVLVCTCVLGFTSGLVITPRAAGPACTLPYKKVTVPAGGSLTVTSTGTRSNLVITPRINVLCGWVFISADGSDLTLNCARFSLSRMTGAKFLVTDRLDRDRRFTYSGSSGPRNQNLGTSEAIVAMRHYEPGTYSSFTCTVSSQSDSSTDTGSTGTDTGSTGTDTGSTGTDTGSTGTDTGSTGTDTTTNQCRCGIVNRQSSRIVGGTATESNEYPWQAGLVYPRGGDDVFCGGTLIDDRHILTAAHCTEDLNAGDFSIILGAHSTTNDAPTAIKVNPIKITNHADYGNPNMDNDIAIIEIEPLDFTDPEVQVRPACLPDSTEQYAGSQATVTGWGRLYEDGPQPAALREVTLSVISNTVCSRTYGSTITSNMLCAGGSSAGGKDSCQGDSGGPLVTPDGENYELIGVVSFGSGCAEPNVPGVYARVTSYMDWIARNTAGSTTCSR